MSMPEADIINQVTYMASTIPSSWEFIDVVFLLSRVSRSLAQQITRTRNASFAMQSQRVTDMREVSWDVAGDDANMRETYGLMFLQAMANYSYLVDEGMELENARDVLPIGVHCNLVAKYNFRSFVELVRKRQSLRVQAPYRQLVDQMKDQVLRVWPWTQTFFEEPQAKALKMIESVALELAEKGAMYKGPAGQLAKAMDLIKSS